MFLPNPPVDSRSRDDLVAETTALVRAYTTDPLQPGSGWAPPSGGSDPATALIRIFALMAKYAIDRVNLFPDKAFLAFLDMIGAQPAPPRPALCPLTFFLANGSTTGTLVPAGTQVGATPVAGDTGEVTFETEQDLVVTPAQLVSILSYQPSGDLYADRTDRASGAAAGFYPVFAGEIPIEHGLYLAADAILTLPAGTQVTVTIQLAQGASATDWQALGLQWSYWSLAQAAWQPLNPTLGNNALTLGFALPSDLAAITVNGEEASFLRAELTSWPASPVTIPIVQSITLTSAAVTHGGVAPDAAVSGAAGSIDLTADFYPFGEQPRFNSIFYLSGGAALATPGAQVSLTVALSAQRQPLAANDAPLVAWEVWTGSAWTEVGRSTKSSVFAGQTNTYGFADNTCAFTRDPSTTPSSTGVVTFTLPATVAPTTVQGTAGSWLRIRLLGADNYGLGVTLVSVNNVLTAVDDGYRPPIVRSLTLAYTVTPSAAATGFRYNDLTFTSLGGAAFVPFVRAADTEPALYLGFDQAFENRPVLLYVQIAPLSVADLASLGDASSPPTLEWEYSGPNGWAPLGAADETRGFAESGLVSFIGPSDFTSSAVLGQSRWWLRVRLHQGTPAAPPRAGRISINTVWASHTTTTQTEILGSSDGSPSQTFSLLHTPVLAGQRIVVREPELPSPDEQAAIEELEGSDAILIVPGVRGQADQIWVRWHAVTDFYGSGTRDRHYRIDRDTGAVSFGDGLHGMVPPQGVQNIWSFFYQSGGGAQGNRAAGTVNQLKTALASISGVVNNEAASGGADTEPLDRVKELGPTVLRNGGRAVAAQDYEDLALAASADLARARLIPPHFDPIEEAQNPNLVPAEAGQVTLVIVPFSDDSPPTPGLGLIRDVEAYLRARMAPAATLIVTGPLWIQVSVGLTIVPVSREGADPLRAEAVAAVTRFLHPLTGGFDGAGWAFGQIPQASDFYRLVTAIPGVNAVRGFTLETDPTPVPTDASTADRILIYSGTHTVVITAPDDGG
jgi:hypothetical protein